MLFRRIKAHIEKENWFAVFVDFFIVVVGILIAFQIEAWADRQATHKATTASLTMLLDDLSKDIDRLDVVAEAQKTKINALQRVIDELMLAKPNYPKIAGDINLAADNTRTLLARDTVYDTMEQEGQLLVLPLELQRKISVTYGYDFPALATLGLQIDDNRDEVDSRCIDVYWDWRLGVPISEAREDLARLRNCFTNQRDYSIFYLNRSQGEFRENAEALQSAVETELKSRQ